MPRDLFVPEGSVITAGSLSNSATTSTNAATPNITARSLEQAYSNLLNRPYMGVDMGMEDLRFAIDCFDCRVSRRYDLFGISVALSPTRDQGNQYRKHYSIVIREEECNRLRGMIWDNRIIKDLIKIIRMSPYYRRYLQEEYAYLNRYPPPFEDEWGVKLKATTGEVDWRTAQVTTTDGTNTIKISNASTANPPVKKQLKKPSQSERRAFFRQWRKDRNKDLP